MLIEVMAGAMLVALIAIAVLAGFDGAFATSGKNKARSVAATLAEQDIERMRGYTSVELSGYSETQNKTVAGVPYQVHSSAEWITDTGDSIGCTASSSAAAYLKIRSAVSSNLPNIKPVVSESVMAPTAGEAGAGRGSAAVHVINRAGQSVEGVTVQLAGSTPATGTTNSEGCAAFNSLLAGDYDITLTKTGMVSWFGNGAYPNKSVLAGQTTVFELEFDTAARINMTFDTRNPVTGTTSAVNWNDGWQGVTAASAGIPLTPGMRAFTKNPLSPGAIFTTTTASATNLYPFTAGYDVFAGKCWIGNPSQQSPAQPVHHVATDPGGVYPMTVRVPMLHVTVRRSGSNYSSGSSNDARVYARYNDPACGGTVQLGTTVANGGGSVMLPMPYGTYDLCVDRGNSTDERGFLANHVHNLATGTPDGNTSQTGVQGVSVSLNTSETVLSCEDSWPAL